MPTSSGRWYLLNFKEKDLCVSFYTNFGLCSNFRSEPYHRRETVGNVVLEEAAIRVPGPIPNISPEAYKTMVLKRMSCQVTHQNFVYFGEIRENDTCVFDRQLLTKPISVGIRFEESVDFDVGTCTNETRPHLQEDFRAWGINIYIFRCNKARIHCVGSSPNKIPSGCEGVIQKGKSTYLCLQFANRVGSKWTASCREIRNFDFENEGWFYGREIDPDDLYNNIGAASIMQTGRRRVKIFKGSNEITQIRKEWFGLCAAKVSVVITLVCAVMYAIFHNAACVVNDERSLARLLTSSVSRPFRPGEDESTLYLHATRIGRRTIFWASGHPLRRKRWFEHENYNREMHRAEKAAM